MNVRVLSSDSRVPEHIFTNFALISYNLPVVFFDNNRLLITLGNSRDARFVSVKDVKMR